MKRISKIIAALGCLCILSIVSSCSKDPLNGKWTDGESVLTFNTKDKTVSIKYLENEASGSYDFGQRQKMLIKVDKWVEMNQDYTDFYSDLDYTFLTSLSLGSDNTLLVADLFSIPILMEPSLIESTEPVSGKWTYTEGTDTVTLELDAANSKFYIKEFSPDYVGFLGDENGVILDASGPYKTEECQYIFMNFIIDGLPSGNEGEFVLSQDGKTLSIGGIDFTRL